MRSEKIKRLLLGILALILVYIWWGNVGLFFGTDETMLTKLVSPAVKPMGDQNTVLEYREAKVNPFAHQLNSKPPPLPRPTRQTQEAQLPRLGQHYRLSGVISKGSSSQAVLRSATDSSHVLSLGDSLAGWQLIDIQTDHAVFGHDKLKDTLQLASPQ